jgi:hypothetical protein
VLERVYALIAKLRSTSAQPARTSISLEETGFRLRSMDQPTDVERFFDWQGVTTMIAYKRDCFAYDMICLAIADASIAVEIREEDDGWDAFIRAAEKNLPGSVPVDTWWPAVAQPPFATNTTTVYRKGQTASQSD